MFEIMQALSMLNQACRKHGTSLHWYIEEDCGEMVLRANVPITEEDQHVVEQMVLLLGAK